MQAQVSNVTGWRQEACIFATTHVVLGPQGPDHIICCKTRRRWVRGNCHVTVYSQSFDPYNVGQPRIYKSNIVDARLVCRLLKSNCHAFATKQMCDMIFYNLKCILFPGNCKITKCVLLPDFVHAHKILPETEQLQNLHCSQIKLFFIFAVYFIFRCA